MDKGKSERFYRQLAAQYAKADGERLLRELAELEADGVIALHPRLDERVRAIPRRAKRRRRTRNAGLLAAGLLLVLLAPQILRYNRQAELAAPSEAPAAEAAVDDTADEELVDEEPDMAQSSEHTAAYEVIPLAFELPANLSVIGIQQDNAQSIYFLSDILQDDVVLTMEYTERAPQTEGLVEIELDGALTYGVSTGDYSLLTFHSEGILYTLTCRYDINTLLPLGKSIL